MTYDKILDLSMRIGIQEALFPKATGALSLIVFLTIQPVHRLRILRTLDNHRDSLAASNTSGGQTITTAAPVQFMQEREYQTRPRGA